MGAVCRATPDPPVLRLRLSDVNGDVAALGGFRGLDAPAFDLAETGGLWSPQGSTPGELQQATWPLITQATTNSALTRQPRRCQTPARLSKE